MEYEDTIRSALEAAERDGHTITSSDAIIEYVAKALRGELNDADEVFHAGYRLVRKLGSEMKRRGAARDYYGWEIIDPETDEVVGSFPPNSDGGTPLSTIKDIAATKRELADLRSANSVAAPR